MNAWPEWGIDLAWTVAAVGTVYLVGYTLRIIFAGRLARMAARTSARWDDELLTEVKKRLPLWSLLIGVYLALPRWALAPSTERFVHQVLSAVGVASVTFMTAAVLSRVALDYGAKASVPVSGLTQNLVRIAVTILGALVIVRSFGYDIMPMLTVLGVGGLAVALALQEPLSNLFAGLFVSLAGQVRIGDYVRLDNGAEGYVADLNWRSTLLRQGTGNLVEVPNSKLAQAVVTNFSQPGLETSATVDVTVDHDNDLVAIERLAMEVASAVVRDVSGAVVDQEPVVRFGAVSDIGVRLAIIVRVASFAEQGLIKHEIIKRLHQRFAASGVTFADARPLPAPTAPKR